MLAQRGSSSSAAIVAILALVLLAGAAWFIWGRGTSTVVEKDTTIIEHDHTPDAPSIDVDLDLDGKDK